MAADANAADANARAEAALAAEAAAKAEAAAAAERVAEAAAEAAEAKDSAAKAAEATAGATDSVATPAVSDTVAALLKLEVLYTRRINRQHPNIFALLISSSAVFTAPLCAPLLRPLSTNATNK